MGQVCEPVCDPYLGGWFYWPSHNAAFHVATQEGCEHCSLCAATAAYYQARLSLVYSPWSSIRVMLDWSSLITLKPGSTRSYGSDPWLWSQR
ncbi:hypothetical protein AOLI_G00094590 [Acnodon oligacanthus]